MGRIHIKKKLGYNLRSTAKIKIFVDEKLIDILENEKIETVFEARKGQLVRVKHQWCSSAKYEILNDEERLVIDTFLPDETFLIILISTLIFSVLTIFTEYYYFSYFSVLILIYPLYFIILKPNMYLRINKVATS